MKIGALHSSAATTKLLRSSSPTLYRRVQLRASPAYTVQVKRVDSTPEVSNLIARREQTQAFTTTLTFGVSIADAMVGLLLLCNSYGIHKT